MKKIILLSCVLFIICFSSFNCIASETNNSNVKLAQNPQLIQYYEKSMKENKNKALSIAINSDNLELVKKALKINRNIEVKDYDGRTPLMLACQKGNLDIIKYLIKKGANIKAKDPQGNTPLMYAVVYKHFDLIKLLLDKGANINTVNDKGENLLVTAASYVYSDTDSYNIIDLLIERGINLNAGNLSEIALISLLKNNNINSAKLLMKKANIQISPSMLIVTLNFKTTPETIDFLIKNGADINCKYIKGQSPILKASAENSFEVFNFLVKNGANINDVDDDKNTALIMASSNFRGGLDISKYLLSKGCSVDAKNNMGKTALMVATNSAVGHKDFPIVKLLLEKGANINLKDNNGKTPLIYIVDSGKYGDSTSIIGFLARNGANINAQDNNGKTVLMYASEMDNYSAAKTLLKLGANVNDKDKNGKTAIIYSAGNTTADILADYGANVNAQDKDGKTALIYANIGIGRYSTETERLIKNGADVKVTDNQGKTAIDYAKEHPYSRTLGLMQNPNTIQKLSRDQLPCDTDDEVHIVGINGLTSSDSTNRIKGIVNIKVSIKNKPIVLYLSSYYPIEWNITQLPDIKIKKVIIVGYYRQTFKGLSPNIPVIITSVEEDSGADGLDGNALSLPHIQYVEMKLGVKPKTIQGGSYGNYFEIDGKKTMSLPSSNR